MSETGITETDFPSAIRQKAQGSTDLPFWFAVAYEIESLRRQLAAQKLEWEKAYGIGVTCKQQLADTQRLLAESQAEARIAKRQEEIMRHDFAPLAAFHEKHALGPMMAPSCLVCGRLPEEVAIYHAELPGIVVCKKCANAATALDAAIAKAKREENEVCEGICNRFAGREMHPAECAAAIRMRRMADELKCGEQ